LKQLTILNFHGIGVTKRELPASEQKVWLDEAQFLPVLDFLQGKPNVELTFDDANESDFTIALPALQARGFTARFFIVAGRVGQPGFLTRPQLDALVAAGMRIGSHGLNHRAWAELNDAELHRELVDARVSLERWTGITVREAACPFGSYDRRVLRALRRAGHRHVYTSDCGSARAGAFILPRNTVYRDADLSHMKSLLVNRPAAARRAYRGLKLLLKRLR
jgi:peptidoglycan/xylan/chitin deacetylase (PgdA/CDA1 family)